MSQISGKRDTMSDRAKLRRYTHRVIRIRDGANVGEHTSEDLARKRVRRLVSMSKGRLTEAAFRIEPCNYATASNTTK
jgi:hypothetical protein